MRWMLFQQGRRLRAVVGAVLLVCACTGCALNTSGESVTVTPPSTETPLPTVTPSPTAPATLDQRIDAYINTLSPEQQVGQTIMLAVYANSYNANLAQALTQWHVGSAIFFPNHNGGPVMPTTAAGVRTLLAALQSHADVPLLIATDEEGGEVDRLSYYYGASPSPQSLAATGNPQTAFAQAQTDAQRMKSLGINVDFAPLADVSQGGGIDPSRMFGSTPSAVATYAGAFLDGLQQNGVAGTLKHWPGLGASSGNPDYTLPTVSHTQAQLQSIDFAPYRKLLSHQPDMIMVTTVMVPAYDAKNPADLSSPLVQGVLRGQIGYQGVVVTDAMEGQGLSDYMQQQGYSDATQGIAEACVRAFLAGDDIIEAPLDHAQLGAVVQAMNAAVASGRISPARLRESLRRIIALKVKLGLLTLPQQG